MTAFCRSVCLGLFAALSLWSAGPAVGADKSGVSPQVLSLPKGPGSIEGLGEAFQPSLNSGTAKHSVGIKLPPGTAGHAPSLGLVYEGGDGNGTLGLGWQLPMSYVQLQTDKGIPKYDGTDRFINDGREELVPVANGADTDFFCKNEGSFVRYRRIGSHWEAHTPDGSRLIFGESASARVLDKNQPSRVFRWHLERMIDTRGNTILYRYSGAPGDENLNQVYCRSVEYGPGSSPHTKFHFAAFGYEARSDWFEDCRSGFPVRTGLRLKNVWVGTQGVPLPDHLQGDYNSDGTVDALNRRYDVSYLPSLPVSLVSGITVTGSDGVTALPPSTYGYTLCRESTDLDASADIIGSENTPPLLFDTANVDFNDMNGDALPDLLRTISPASGHRVHLNQGEREDALGKYIQWSAAETVDSAGAAPASALMLEGDSNLLADFDGDGSSDFVQMTGSATYYFPNQPVGGTASWGARNPLAGALPPSPFGTAADVRTGDFNFDKRIDIIRSLGLNGYDIWFNQGGGGFSDPVRINSPSYDLSQPASKLADLNGDRLIDVARISPTGVAFKAGIGHGRFMDERAMTLPDYVLTADQVAKASLQDINGDGVADLVVDRPIGREVWFWLNRGNLTFGNHTRLFGFDSTFTSDAAVRWVDLNGNGTTDMVVAKNGALAAVDIGRLSGCVPKPFLLNSIKNGIGRVETITYTTSVEFALKDGADAIGGYSYDWPHPLPFPVTVIKEIQTGDGMGNTYRTAFRYHDGYYDPEEKQFRGFGRVEQEDVGDASAPTLVTAMIFDTGAADETRKGKPLRKTARTGVGEIFTDETTQWETKNLHTGTDGRAVRYSHQQLATVDVLEKGAGTPRRIETEFAFDNFGNQTEKREYGIVEGANRSAFNDERTTVTEYAYNLTDWLIRFPKQSELRSADGSVFFRSRTFYDDETFSAGNHGVVTVGNSTLVRVWPEPVAKPAKFIDQSRTGYDAYGNPVRLYDPLYGQELGHWREIGFDPDFRAYPESETIHLGGGNASLLAAAGYDKGFGVVVSFADFNANPTRFHYDPLARLEEIVKPGDSDAAPTEVYSYHLAQSLPDGRLINWVESRKRETAGGGTFDYRAYVDGLGRSLQSRCEGAQPGQFVVSGATEFNARRETSRTYLPYFAESFDFSVPAVGAADSTEVVYDATLRPLSTTNPPEIAGGSRRSSRTAYEPLKTILFDEEDNTPGSPHFDTPHVQYKDGLGRLTGVDETNQENGVRLSYPTRYRYDANDQLTGITDSQNNVKSMLFDGLKRMTFMHDPDRGVMSYVYDDASNLRETLDAKNQRILMTYDGANRIKTEDYLDAAGRTPDVTYSYDTAAPVPAGDGTSVVSQQVKGKLVSVIDLSGAEHFSYDTRGRTAWKIKRIPDPVTGVLASYQSAFSYDSLDRLDTLTYPDGDTAGYGYNARNLPQTIIGGPGGFIISGMTYQASGQLKSTTYGNGVATSYSYDPRLRLRTLNTQLSALSAPLIAFSYQFDAASNITRIVDDRAAIPAADPRKNTQDFGYDDLYRLTSVQYPALLGGSSGNIGYAYDRIGNMLSQVSNISATENGLPLTNLGTMSYGGTAGASGRIGRSGGQPGPHALTAVSGGSRSYPYDANGNMETIDGMACSWDFKDRLVAVENAQMRAEYTYDYTDRRITKTVTPKTTFSGPSTLKSQPSTVLYVDRTFEIREDGAPTKYVWNGEIRVARVTTNLNATLRLQRFRLQPGWNFCTLAVALTNAGTQFGVAPVQEVFRYDTETKTYAVILPGEAMPAGTLLRVRASAAAELAVRGTPAAATPVLYPAGRHWVGNATFQPLDLATALPAEAPFWFWQAGTQAYRYRLPGALSTASNAPSRLEPGEAIFALHTAAFTVAPADPTLEVRYYHQDHLGSSSVMTDTTGQLVSESTFYPFGHPRNEHEPRNVKEAYGFIHKERDGESGLNYFEARFLFSAAAIFCSPDSVVVQLKPHRLADPQGAHSYRYARANPLLLRDTDGNDFSKFMQQLENLPIGVPYSAERSVGNILMTSSRDVRANFLAQNPSDMVCNQFVALAMVRSDYAPGDISRAGLKTFTNARSVSPTNTRENLTGTISGGSIVFLQGHVAVATSGLVNVNGRQGIWVLDSYGNGPLPAGTRNLPGVDSPGQSGKRFYTVEYLQRRLEAVGELPDRTSTSPASGATPTPPTQSTQEDSAQATPSPSPSDL